MRITIKPPTVPAPATEPHPDDPRIGDIIAVEDPQGKLYAGLVVGIVLSGPKRFRTRFWEGDRNWIDLIPADKVKGTMRRLPGNQWPGKQKNPHDCWQRKCDNDLPGLWNQATGLSGLIGDGVLEWYFTSHYTYVRLAESKENTVMPPKPEETPVAQPAPAPTALPTLPLTLPHSQLPALIRGLVEQTNRPALQSAKLFFRRGIKDFQTPAVMPKDGPQFPAADRYYLWQTDGSLAVYELLMVAAPPGGERASVVCYLGVVLPENWIHKA